MLPLATWSNFYVIVGSSAGALTGLTFVVISLFGGRQMENPRRGLNAYTTPIVVHFGAVLVITAILSAPWMALVPVALLLGVGSLAGLVYTAVVVWRIAHTVSYLPEWDDWLWYSALPVAAYTVLFLSAILLLSHPTPALFGIGAVLVLLLAVGIRDAWDIVTYVAIQQFTEPPAEPDHQPGSTDLS